VRRAPRGVRKRFDAPLRRALTAASPTCRRAETRVGRRACERQLCVMQRLSLMVSGHPNPLFTPDRQRRGLDVARSWRDQYRQQSYSLCGIRPWRMRNRQWGGTLPRFVTGPGLWCSHCARNRSTGVDAALPNERDLAVGLGGKSLTSRTAFL